VADVICTYCCHRDQQLVACRLVHWAFYMVYDKLPNSTHYVRRRLLCCETPESAASTDLSSRKGLPIVATLSLGGGLFAKATAAGMRKVRQSIFLLGATRRTSCIDRLPSKVPPKAVSTRRWTSAWHSRVDMHAHLWCWEHWFLARLDLRQELVHIRFDTKHNLIVIHFPKDALSCRP